MNFLSEPIDLSLIPIIHLDNGDVHRDPVLVDHWHGLGTLFTEEHTQCVQNNWVDTRETVHDSSQ